MDERQTQTEPDDLRPGADGRRGPDAGPPPRAPGAREAVAHATGRLASTWQRWRGHLPAALAALGASGPVIPDASGPVLGVVGDGEGDARDAAVLSRSEADGLLALAGIARFDWDLRDGRVRWGVVPIHDETLASVDRLESLLAHCHPRDLDRLREDMRGHLRGRQAIARSEFRLRTVRGGWRWYALCGRVVDTDGLGEPRRFAGLIQDVDDRRRAMRVRSTQDALFADGPVRLATLGGAPGAGPAELEADLARLLGGIASGAAPGERPAPPRPLDAWVRAEPVPGARRALETAGARPGQPVPAEMDVADPAGGWRRVRLQLAAEREEAAPAGGEAPVPVVHAYVLDVASAPPAAPAGTGGDRGVDDRLRAAVSELGTMQQVLQALQRLNERLQASEGEAHARQLVEEAAAAMFPAWSGAARLSEPDGPPVLLVAWGGDAPAATDPHQLAFPIVVGTQPGVLEMSSARPLDEATLRGHAWAAASFAEMLGLSLGNVRLREQAVQDWLTGLGNRRAFDEALRRESRRAQRGAQGLALAILDIDHFKSFNDAFGHDAGDEVLRAVARETLAFGRATDTACRIGGEELAVLMPGAAVDDACERLEELRARIAGLRLAHEGVALPPVTVSIGVAEGMAGLAGNLQRRADIALYAAKRAGRDCVRCWSPGLDEDSGFAPLDAGASSLGL